MFLSFKNVGLLALAASATPSVVHFDVDSGSVNQKALSSDKPVELFSTSDVSALDNCCCGGADDTEKTRKSQCPALNGQTKLVGAGYPTTFYCGGHINGDLISKDKRPTLEACAAQCGPTYECYSIDYNQATQDCWYYRGGKAPSDVTSKYHSAVLEPLGNADCAKMNGQTRNLEGRTTTFYCGKQISGNWMKTVPADSFLACGLICAQTDGCHSGDFIEGGKQCWLYTGGGTLPGKDIAGANSFNLSSTRCETVA